MLGIFQMEALSLSAFDWPVSQNLRGMVLETTNQNARNIHNRKSRFCGGKIKISVFFFIKYVESHIFLLTVF